MLVADSFFFWSALGTDNQDAATTVALYSMISAIAVALLAIIGNILVTRINKARTEDNTPAQIARRVSREHEAWERFLLLQRIDGRKIKTGYESMEEVKMDAP